MDKLDKLNKLNALACQISKITSISEIKEILKLNVNAFGMEFFLLGVATPYSALKTNVLIVDNYPKSWREFYDKNKLVTKDPVVAYCLRYHSPILWSQLKKENFQSNKLDIFIEAQKFGIVDGFSIPIHGNGNQFGMVSMASSKNMTNESLSISLAMIQMLIPSIQDAINRLINPISDRSIKLTPREVECLKWAAEGKSGWEMSKILDCTERTISFHMSNIGNKLNSNNRTQSIAKAILLGYLLPSLEY